MSISESLIKEQAITFSEKLGHIEFVASTGGMDEFEKRHGKIQKIISGERADVSDMEWKLTVMGQFQPKDIFTADETQLFKNDKFVRI
ncbi:hypothetical protein QE152_g36711 [Popillia japonica]|uniref:HTH CENPB-type domain-containing protein n=1 Tax=Popillia japonica TaxID=7064 RepID=A0AAW1ID24_POPJA